MIRLVVFDCDGTLVDSQHLIVEAMTGAFRHHDLPPPPADAVRHVVGLSLGEAVAALAPGLMFDACLQVAETYKQSFRALRRERPDLVEPTFDGVRETLLELDRRGHLLGIATGKSRRGVAAVLGHHGLDRLFASVQTADDHPSKPHPAMLEQAMAEAGSRPDETILVGDTTYDVGMAVAAGVRPVGVAWGYHPADALQHAGAEEILGRFDEVLDLVAREAP
jgi:phosphoglycolate phosphatase